MPVEMPQLMSMRDIEKNYNIPYGSIRKMCIRGEVKYRKIGKCWMINLQSLADYLDGETNNGREY